MKGLDNSTPESYLKLRPASSYEAAGRALFLLFPLSPLDNPLPLSRCALFSFVFWPSPPSPYALPLRLFQTRLQTFKQQFDKMQISFVSRTTINSLASHPLPPTLFHFPSSSPTSPLLHFSAFPCRRTTAPLFRWQSRPISRELSLFPSWLSSFFSLSLSSFFVCMLLFDS